jgi:dissimilatory sulfite reductase (desulfoviridin) alpha/beta subunit
LRTEIRREEWKEERKKEKKREKKRKKRIGVGGKNTMHSINHLSLVSYKKVEKILGSIIKQWDRWRSREKE